MPEELDETGIMVINLEDGENADEAAEEGEEEEQDEDEEEDIEPVAVGNEGNTEQALVKEADKSKRQPMKKPAAVKVAKARDLSGGKVSTARTAPIEWMPRDPPQSGLFDRPYRTMSSDSF